MGKKNSERKQSITMYEIARLAGVSQSTVSRVLNGNTPVAPDKQAAVLEVVERLNYRPNLAAQGLVSGKTSEIGVMTRHLGSPFFVEILRGIARGLESSKYHLAFGVGSEVGSEDRREVDLLLARRVDGLIVQVSQDIGDEYLCEIAESIPLIVIGRQIRGLEKQCVVVGNYHGAYMATSYLIDKGHKLIAHITGNPALQDAVERREGYCKAMVDRGLDVIPDLIVEGDFTETSGTLAVDKLLARRDTYPFTAIFAGNDQMAVGARLGMFYRRIGVPEDVSLVGFDDLASSQYMIPPLTTIRQPAYYMGLMATQAMLSALSGGSIHLPEFPVELVVRQSVAIR